MSEEKKDGGCAFPCPGNSWSKGMSLRDYFAAQAVQGLLSSSTRDTAKNFANTAYEIADAMLKARNGD